ncbi:MAG: hypothetical protein CMJ75_03710 [Planctomycetaceae bacterium]|nr:hypothetical protein [Planctomycetaceae bacterium]
MDHSEFVLVAKDGVGANVEKTRPIVGKPVKFGRSADNELALRWDSAISRHHGTIVSDRDSVTIRCNDNARNSIIFQGSVVRELTLSTGDEFEIGTTRFSLIRQALQSEVFAANADSEDEPELLNQVTFTSSELRAASPDAPEKQLAALAKIPSLIESAKGGQELAEKLAQLVLQTQPLADAAAVMEFRSKESDDNRESPWGDYVPVNFSFDVRATLKTEFRPSKRVTAAALSSGQTTVHSWGPSDNGSLQATITDGLGWAIAVPVQAAETCWCIYISGPGVVANQDQLASNCRFIELVGEFLRSITAANAFHERKSALSSFLSPSVADKVLSGGGGGVALEPSESTLAVLFCDLRGFSRISETYRDDLMSLYKRIRSALSVMAGGIIDAEGAIADFQGDAALGFWGWPIADSAPAVSAVSSALSILHDFSNATEASEKKMLEGLSLGIGIATGTGLAGQIGTQQQAKIGVFGPIVNQGARLEGITKLFGCKMCFDKQTAAQLAESEVFPAKSVRQLASLKPAGMNAVVDVFTLVTPQDDQLSGEPKLISDYQQALDSFASGNWQEANDMLQQWVETDRPSKFLVDYIAKFGPQSPDDWMGAIQLHKK